MPQQLKRSLYCKKQWSLPALLAMLLLLLSQSFLLSQNALGDLRNTPPANLDDLDQPMGYKVPKPIFGMSIGTFSYFGNIAPKNYFQNPGVSRYAVSIFLSEKISNDFYLNLYGLTGTLGVAQDANTTRNANFMSEINLGGANITYNFNRFLPEGYPVKPFISLGFEAFTFNSKTDLYDKNGNKYYYWNDGTIRNIPQSSPDSLQAKMLSRSYNYSTDIRQANAYGNGNYPTHSYAVPIGIGTIFKLSDRIELNIHCVYHFTFTNEIDGIGSAYGSKRNDAFMETGFGLHWDLLGPKKHKADTLNNDYYKNVNFEDLMAEDQDGDGVRDTADLCPCTPKGATVDAHGCVLDGDADGVPDYLDKEPNSKPFAAVDENGVTLSDSVIALKFRQFYDTTNATAEVIAYFHGEYDHSGGRIIKRDHHLSPKGMFVPDDYTILLGRYDKGVPTTAMTQFLSIRDIETTNMPDSSIAFTAGHYKTFDDAKARKEFFIKNGNPQAKIVYRKNNEFVPTEESVGPPAIAATTNDQADANDAKGKAKSSLTKSGKGNLNAPGNKNLSGKNKGGAYQGNNIEDSLLVANTKGLVFRVQLGAYEHRLSKAVFKSIPDLIEIRTEDNLYKYMTGNYTKFEDAAKAQVEMNSRGYSGAFINAYQDGKRVSLRSVGATPSKAGLADNSLESTAESKGQKSVFEKSKLKFKVQLGIFKNDLNNADKLKFKNLKDELEIDNTEQGLTRYTVGNTSDYNEILELKNKVKKAGFEDAFILSIYNGQLIPIREALEISK